MAIHQRAVAIFFVLVVAVAVTAFQNCGQLTPSSSAVQRQASLELAYKRDLEIIRSVTGSGNLLVWILTRQSEIDKTDAGVNSIASVHTGGFRLTKVQDAPTLVNSSVGGIQMISMQGNSTLATAFPDGFTSNAATLIALIEPPLSGSVLLLSSGSTTEAMTIEVSGSLIRARHYTDGLNYETLALGIPAGDAPIVVAASFGSKLGQLSLQVNGRAATGMVSNQGAPVDASNVTRQLTIGDIAGKTKIAEVMALSSALTPGELNTMSRYFGERWGLQSVQYDGSLYPADGGGFEIVPDNVKSILRANCTNTGCHAHDVWDSWSLANDFKSHSTTYGIPLVMPGDPVNSPLYNRIKGTESEIPDLCKNVAPAQRATTLGCATNMPFGGATLDEASRNVIKNWIQSLKK